MFSFLIATLAMLQFGGASPQTPGSAAIPPRCWVSEEQDFHITMDKHLIPCQANCSLRAIDELLTAHFVFNLSYDLARVNFYTFVETTVYCITLMWGK